MDNTGRVVVVTGGTRGIGRGIAECYLDSGAEVVVCARRPPDMPVTRAPGSGRASRNARFVAADVRDPEQFGAVLDAAEAFTGRLDVLVNNAGGTPAADPARVNARFHRSIIDLNLVAPLQCATMAYERMRAREVVGGSIVMISSVVTRVPNPAAASYSAAKAGLDSLTESLAAAFAPHVRVNAVSPGLIATELLDETYPPEAIRSIPMGRFGTPRDIGNACLMLTDPVRAAYITGATLACHGGRSLRWPIDQP